MTGSPPPTRRTTIGGYPRVVSYNMLGEQHHHYSPVKCWYATCLIHKDGGIPLRALPKNTTSKLAGLFSTLSLFYAERQTGKLLTLCGRIKCSRSRRRWSYLKMADFTRGRFSALSFTSYLPLSAYFCLAVLFLMLFSNNNLKVQLLRNKCITSSRSHHNIKLTKSATIICSVFQYGIF